MNSESIQRVPIAAIKGRGAASWLPHRFHTEAREVFDDGWEPEESDPHVPATTVSWEEPRSAIAHNDSPDVFFERSVNPYRGCEHGCIYCYARPTHSYLGLSPGLDFETRLIAKRNIAGVLKAELARPRYEARTLAVGTVTDCYQPVERELRLTRDIIQLLHDCAHPLTLVTKSSGVERDIDLLAPMAGRRLASVFITLTTLDAGLTRKLEPRAAAPHRRLRTIRALADAGIPVGVSLAPQIPFLTEDLEQVLEAAWEAGARSAFYHVLRLPWELSPLFREWLQVHYPQRAERVMARVQDMRGGKDYDSDFATRMKGSGPWAELIGQRFRRACDRLGFNRERLVLDASAFRRPRLDGQQALFD
ncbi:PA0069 family radical SAM protein [Ramlibacter rhizophilus]|uniref:PA0069 family radical SAM protein n=1 Tax=Ramlibacter rhizophilus TaxID=1781167 RepID=A0A4Z0BCL9_9BURK|nr:PA0069 family radical SAM protein [Ramlibacter rhizophilus]TFY96421.1 PA0069 family radical SAM protein [Ramlibacter rhizophilus]